VQRETALSLLIGISIDRTKAPFRFLTNITADLPSKLFSFSLVSVVAVGVNAFIYGVVSLPSACILFGNLIEEPQEMHSKIAYSLPLTVSS